LSDVEAFGKCVCNFRKHFMNSDATVLVLDHFVACCKCREIEVLFGALPTLCSLIAAYRHSCMWS
jgi:hypothetical protein